MRRRDAVRRVVISAGTGCVRFGEAKGMGRFRYDCDVNPWVRVVRIGVESAATEAHREIIQP